MKTKSNAVQNTIQFCIWCGNEIKPGSKFCPKCGKKQIEEENQLVDWLIKHTKDKLKGDAESTLFDAVKNFILSHLYGTVMSIAIVAAVGITAYAGEPYIEKYRDADKPVYITEALNATQSPDNIPSQNISYMDINTVRTICNDYLTVVQSPDNSPTDPVYNLVVPDSFPVKGDFEVVYDEKFVSTTSFYLRDSSSKVIQKAEELTMDISKQLADKNYTVSEYIKEQYIEDAASAEKVYTRTIAFSVVEIDGIPYIAASSIVRFEENENYEWPIEVDTAKLESMMTDYINAVFTGGDLTPYEYHLPDEDNVTLYRHVLTLPEKCYGFISVDDVHVGLYQRASSLPAGDVLDEMGYEKFSADIRVTVNEQTEGRQMQTTHNFVFVVIDGQYYAVDDYITTVGHSG